jgi:tetratricopeptide (TPR) repeat protein
VVVIMGPSLRTFLILVLPIVLPGRAPSQTISFEDRPARHVPVRTPTQAEKNHQEALRLYGVGVLQEKKNRLIEATRTLEEAQQLDPESAMIVKALIPLYLSLERIDDALAGCRKALKLDPDDCETAFLYARQLRGLDRRKEAVDVLVWITRSAGLKERPDLKAQIWFDLGGLHEQDKRWDDAEEAYREVTKVLDKPEALLEMGSCTAEDIQTQAGETWERLGQVCLKANRPGRAIEAFEKAQKKDPSRAGRLAFNLAQVYETQGKLPAALAQLELYLQTQPQGIEVYERKIALQRRSGQERAILPDLAAACERDPNNTALHMLLAREYRRANRRKDAEGVYRGLLKNSPGPEVYRGLFELCKDAERAGGMQALNMLNQALEAAAGSEKEPGSPSEAANARAMLIACREDRDLVRLVLEAAHRRLVSGEGRADRKIGFTTRGVLATLAARTGQLALAEEFYRSCLNRPGGLRDLEAEVYGGLLRVLRLRHKNREVIDLCKQGLETAQATNRVLFHQEMAHAHAALGETKEALKAADSAVAEAGFAQALYCRRTRLGILSQAGKHDEAIAEAQALLKEYNQGGDLRDVRLALADIYLAAGKPEQSEDQLQLILQADPTDATANNNLGYQWADRNKNLDEAEKLIRKAIDLDRKQRNTGTSIGADGDRDAAAYVDSLGWVHFRLGKLDEARRELEQAAELPDGQDDPVVWDHLGDVYFRLEQKPQAVEAWKKSLSLYDLGARHPDERTREIREKLRLINP